MLVTGGWMGGLEIHLYNLLLLSRVSNFSIKKLTVFLGEDWLMAPFPHIRIDTFFLRKMLKMWCFGLLTRKLSCHSIKVCVI